MPETIWARGVRAAAFGLLWAVLAHAVPAAAATVVMTPTTVTAALAAVQPGDTLRMEGVFTSQIVMRDRDFGGVQVDASAATLQAGIRIMRVHNISFSGGDWWSPSIHDAVRIEDSSHVSFADATLTGTDARRGRGASILRSSFVTMRDSVIDRMLDSVIVASSTDSLITGNRFENGGSDGIQISNSHRIIASFNSCTGYTLIPTYHPDCIQLWSLAGFELQSDIYILNNLSIGPQQGFNSFSLTPISGTRLTFAGNYAVTSTSNPLSCLGCTDSRFYDNVLVTAPDALWSQDLTVTGSGNAAAGNLYYDLRGQFGAPLPDRLVSSLNPSIAWQAGSSWADRSFGVAPVSGVPEPAGWTMLIGGFALIGSQLRRKRRLAAA